MGFDIPGIDGIRFHVAPNGIGDVQCTAEPGHAQDTPKTTLPSCTLLYPLSPCVSCAITKATAARYLNPIDEVVFAQLVASSAARVAEPVYREADFAHEPSAPRTTVVPLLPLLDPSIVEDEWGLTSSCAHSHRSTPRDDVGWREVSIEAAATSGSSSSLARRPGAAADFVRGSLANNVPFTPGGAGWEDAAAEAAAARQAAARRASVAWLTEYESGVYSGVPPGFSPSSWTDEALDQTRGDGEGTMTKTGSSAALSASGAATMTYDDLLMSALRITPDDGETPSDVDVDSESGEEDEVEADNDAGTATEGPEAELEALLRSVDPTRRARNQTKGERLAALSKKKEDEWAVMERLPDVDDALRREVPEPAHAFPFELDTFQKEAIYRLERNECVFVAAHTSAGKTVVAEYAFALATKHCTRAIYTSPIKTISNQKFRDFGKQFDVGLLTGDVSIKADAPCLIMTTEILRSMLYCGADLIRDVEWVIFDEVHYVNDAERGVVWEEVIIMLPAHVGLVLLSATVPNVWEFADWVGRTKRKKVFVTGTTRRPVPLEHMLYFGGDKEEDFYKIGEREQFLPGGYKAATDALNKSKKSSISSGGGAGVSGAGRGSGRGGGRDGGRGGYGRGAGNSGNKHPGRGSGGAPNTGGAMGVRGRDKSVWVELIRCLEKRELLPMVVFAFSKKRCDQMVDSLTGMDLTAGAEKHEIHIFCERCLSRLSPADRQLPQVLRVRELLRRGLGVHHAGLLPIMKEIVEMLFCRGLLKVLFSTETFAMGVNAPARCVCFQDLRKHDGQDFRGLLPGEYTQMAGRAGRRGLDSVGTVIIAAWDNFPQESTVRTLLSGKATKLESQFRLTYGMILNLMRVEDLRVEDMLARSFAEFHAQRSVGDRRGALALDVAALKRVNELAAAEEAADPTGWAAAVAHESASAAVRAAAAEVRAAVLTSRGGQSAMSIGRLLLIAGGGEDGVGDLPPAEKGADGEIPAEVKPSGALGGRGGIDKHGALLRIVSANVASKGSSVVDEAAAKTYVVLLPCPEGHPPPSEEDKQTATEHLAPAATEAEKQPEPAPMLLMRRKGDDDDDDMFGGGFGKKGSFGKKGGSGGFSSSATEDRIDGPMPLGLPWRLQSGGMDYVIAAVRADSVLAITEAKISIDASAVLTTPGTSGSPAPAAAAAVARALSEIERVLSNGTPAALHPVKDLKLQDLAAVEACHEHARLVAAVPALPSSVAPRLRAWHALLDARRALSKRVEELEHGLSDANLQQMPDFETRVEVLQSMGYLDEDRTVTLKGRVACEIATGDELVGTEIIFAGVLTNISPEEAVALLAALVFQEKNSSPPELHGSLLEACENAKQLAFAAGEEQLRRGLPVAPDEFVTATLRFGLTEVVHEWAKGTKFGDICQITDVQEGSIVRTIVRLDEMCRDVRNAARIMGDSALYEKMESASTAIKRDIIFSASLYVSGA